MKEEMEQELREKDKQLQELLIHHAKVSKLSHNFVSS